MTVSTIAASILAFTLAATTLSAQTAPILAVDFGTETSPVQTGFVRMSGLSQEFTNLQGVASGSLTVAFPQAGNRDRGNPSANSGEFTLADLHRDLFTGLNETTTGTTFSISGLDPLTPYQIQLWSYDSGFNPTATYTWYDTTQAVPFLLGTITNSGSAPTTNTQFSIVGAVTSDVSGQVRLGHNDSAGTGAVNGFQLQVIPEPTIGAFLLTGVLGLALRRRR